MVHVSGNAEGFWWRCSLFLLPSCSLIGLYLPVPSVTTFTANSLVFGFFLIPVLMGHRLFGTYTEDSLACLIPVLMGLRLLRTYSEDGRPCISNLRSHGSSVPS